MNLPDILDGFGALTIKIEAIPSCFNTQPIRKSFPRVRVPRDARDVHAPSRELHDEEHVVRDETSPGADLHRKEVGGCQAVPMGAHELPPGRPLPPLGCWLDPVRIEDVAHRGR